MSAMSASISVNLSRNSDMHVSALEEPKTWLVNYVFTTPESNDKRCGAAYVCAKTIADVVPIVAAMCESHMSKVVREDPAQHTKVHEWDGYQITSISLCTSGSL